MTNTGPPLTDIAKRIRWLGTSEGAFACHEIPSILCVGMALALVECTPYPVVHAAPLTRGGIAIRYRAGPRRARYDISQQGGIVVSLIESRDAIPLIREFDLQGSVRTVTDYLATDTLVALFKARYQ